MLALLAGAGIGLILLWLASPWACIALLALIGGLVLWAHLATPRLLAIPATDMPSASVAVSTLQSRESG